MGLFSKKDENQGPGPAETLAADCEFLAALSLPDLAAEIFSRTFGDAERDPYVQRRTALLVLKALPVKRSDCPLHEFLQFKRFADEGLNVPHHALLLMLAEDGAGAGSYSFEPTRAGWDGLAAGDAAAVVERALTR